MTDFFNPANGETPETLGNKILKAYERRKIQFLLISQESAPTTGKIHFHVYMKFNRDSCGITFTALNNKFFNQQAHNEPLTTGKTSTYEKIIEYCRKDKMFFEWGTPPRGFIKGKKQNDLLYTFEALEDGMTINQIIEQNPFFAARERALIKQREVIDERDFGFQPRDLINIYVQGKSNTGKTRSIKVKHKYDVCDVEYDQSFPYNNYNGQSVLLYDEFRSNRTLSEVLKRLNPEPLQLDIKNGKIWAKYTRTFVVSNTNIENQYRDVRKKSPVDWWPFIRRFRYLYDYINFLRYDVYELRGIKKNDGTKTGTFDFKYIKTVQEFPDDPEGLKTHEFVDPDKIGWLYSSKNQLIHYREEPERDYDGIQYITELNTNISLITIAEEHEQKFETANNGVNGDVQNDAVKNSNHECVDLTKM